MNETKADAFLFENVASILHPRNISNFRKIITSFQSSGFNVNYLKVNAVEYGVPQKRQRVIIVGLKNNKPKFPEPTHAASPDKVITERNVLPTVRVADVISEFDDKKYYEDGEVVSGRWEEALREIPPGGNYKALSAWAGHPKPLFEAETRFWHFLLKLHPDLPSWTITASPGPWTGPFHWDDRRLRIPELAAIQGFPKGYTFVGSRRERIRQIGNAVPPRLAAIFLKKLVNAMAV